MIDSFDTLRAEARAEAQTLRLAVVWGVDAASIQAAVRARTAGLAETVLLGPEREIRRAMEREGVAPDAVGCMSCETEAEAAARAVDLARRGAADVIVKGKTPSSTVMHAVLDRSHGLRTGRVLSDVRLYEHPLLPGRFLGVTDGGVIPLPTLAQKRGIIENAARVYHALGVERPRVALLAASEKVTEAIPHTVESRRLTEENARGEIPGCIVDGPLSFDLALVPEAVRLKGYESEVAGRAEVLVGPNIETINVFAKSLVYLQGRVPGQVVVGARVPVLIPSRADSAEVKLNSVALAALVRRRGAS